jgi:hypothetical protein
MIRLTELKISASTFPVLVDAGDISCVGTDEEHPKHATILWMKSTGKFVWVTETVDEVERLINGARIKQSGT